jgi:HD-GYP domain-containing protein (c-di-GMP phosphodiesterase class II)
VADAYDALTSERPYRTGFTHEEALRILKEKAGTQWDAKVVKAAIEALGK